MKGLNDLALKAGAQFVRPETGFVHYFYHGRPSESHATIPLYENLNWALANFQTRTQEGFQEGKRLLEKLLAFQNAEGEFPVYLHEYPYTADSFLGAYLFLPLWWIKKDFETLLGPELRERLNRCLTLLIHALKSHYEEKKPQGHIAIKVGAAVFAMEGSDAILRHAKSEVTTSSHIADIELAKDVGAPHLPSWPALSWHPRLQTYLGPAYKELQEGFEPAIGLLDLMMGSTRKGQLSPHHIAAALVRSSPTLSHASVKGIRQEELWGYSALKMESDAPLFHQPGFHLFRYLTEGEGRIESLALPVSKIKKANFVEGQTSIKFEFGFDPTFEPENRDKQREIELFINLGPKISTSVFRLDEPVKIQFAKTALTLTFRRLAGTGDFIGHLSRGNRPSQIAKGEAFDQVLSLRTLRRSPDALIELEIAFA